MSKRKYAQRRAVVDKQKIELANKLLTAAKVLAYLSAGATIGLGVWFFRIPGGSGLGATFIVVGIVIVLLALKELKPRRVE